MGDLAEIRPATLADVPGIIALHAECDDPWADPAECALWVNHRLLRGFSIDLAVAEGRVVGHAEWIVSDEPEPFGRHLYLGMLDIHRDFQGRGIGRAMVQAGVRRAAERACPCLRTVPDEAAKGFYRKCGLASERQVTACSVEVRTVKLPAGWSRVRTVPRVASQILPMRAGWVQGCSAHMWELCNRPVRVAGDPVYHPCARRVDGSGYVQLRYLGMAYPALVLAWASPALALGELVDAAMALARPFPIDSFNLHLLEGEAAFRTSHGDVRFAGSHEVWSVRSSG